MELTEEFVFFIANLDKEELGLELVADATTGLFWIQGIKEGSLTAYQNTTKRYKKILRCGDCIKCVNGIKNNLDGMRQKMRSECYLELGIARWHVGSATRVSAEQVNDGGVFRVYTDYNAEGAAIKRLFF